jgi:hypothetical protein
VPAGALHLRIALDLAGGMGTVTLSCVDVDRVAFYPVADSAATPGTPARRGTDQCECPTTEPVAATEPATASTGATATTAPATAGGTSGGWLAAPRTPVVSAAPDRFSYQSGRRWP